MESVAVALFAATVSVIVGYASKRAAALAWPRRRPSGTYYEGRRSRPMRGEHDELEIESWVDEGDPEFEPDEASAVKRRENIIVGAMHESRHRSRRISRTPHEGRLVERVGMIHIITLAFLLVSFWIILSGRYEDDVQKWAFGTMGSILGFWLGPGFKNAD
jgi:hypothetical protein